MQWWELRRIRNRLRDDMTFKIKKRKKKNKEMHVRLIGHFVVIVFSEGEKDTLVENVGNKVNTLKK